MRVCFALFAASHTTRMHLLLILKRTSFWWFRVIINKSMCVAFRGAFLYGRCAFYVTRAFAAYFEACRVSAGFVFVYANVFVPHARAHRPFWRLCFTVQVCVCILGCAENIYTIIHKLIIYINKLHSKPNIVLNKNKRTCTIRNNAYIKQLHVWIYMRIV